MQIHKLLFLVLLITSLSSCCKSDLKGTFNFSESDGLVIPYTGDETLNFIDDSNNIVTYNNGYRTIIQKAMEECYGGCCDYYDVERFDLSYFESTYMESNLQAYITNNFDVNLGKLDGPPTISFQWDYYEIEPYVTSTSFDELPVTTMKETAIERGMFKDSLTIHDTKFYNIYTFKGQTIYPERLYADSLFYSESEGIVGIKFSDGSLWTLN